MKLVRSDLVISVISDLFVTESSNCRDQNGDLTFVVFRDCCGGAATLYFSTYHSTVVIRDRLLEYVCCSYLSDLVNMPISFLLMV
jgi:hypothetical protein